MDFVEALKSFQDQISSQNADSMKMTDTQLSRLIESRGILPSSKNLRSKVLSAQQQESSSLEDIALALSGDPVLCLRLIALCNQSFYARGGSISDIETAINHLGLLKIGSIVDELSEEGDYDSALRGRALAVTALQDAVLTGCIARQFFPLFQKTGNYTSLELERSYLYGFSAALWRFLFAYNKPNQYSCVMLDLLLNEQYTFERQIRKLFKRPLPELSAEAMKSIGVPDDFSRVIESFSIPPWNRRSWAVKTNQFTHAHVAAVYTAGRVAHELSLFQGSSELLRLLRELAQKSGVHIDDVHAKLDGLRGEFVKRLLPLGLTPFRIPDYLDQFDGFLVGEQKAEDFQWPSVARRIDPFLLSLKASLKASGDSSRMAQTIYSTLIALTRGLDFDRAVFMRFDEEQRAFYPLALFGRPVEYLDGFVRYVSAAAGQHAPDNQAFVQQRPIFQGDPMFGEDWPFACFPVIWRGTVEGIFYADKKDSEDVAGLSTEEQVAVIALAEEWHHVPDDFH